MMWNKILTFVVVGKNAIKKHTHITAPSYLQESCKIDFQGQGKHFDGTFLAEKGTASMY